jgi:5-formyltetrahydrofolate cyclo-ligase
VTKDEIRKEVLTRRLNLSDPEVLLKSEAICSRLISDEVFVRASTIALYWPFKNEVMTQPVFRAAVSDRKRVGFPLVRAGERAIIYVAVDDPADMVAGTYGIREPGFTPQRVIAAEEFDLIVIPGVAFDTRGYRIGYGGGYFDRFLAGRRVGATRAAPAFDIQIVDRVPQEEYDKKVDVIFTESRVIMCS